MHSHRKYSIFVLSVFKSTLHLFVLTAVFCIFTFAGTVTLDTTFNGTGYRIQSINQDGARGESVVVQPNGKIFIGGWMHSPAFYGPFAGINFNPNGTLNSEFGNNGWVSTSVNAFDQGHKAVAQPDGKILLSGESYSGFVNDNCTIIRYNPNGTRDSTFSGDGVAIFAPVGDTDEVCIDMALQPDGKIILTGTTAPGANMQTDIIIMRVNPNGTLDSTFAGGGILILTFQNVSEAANAVIVQTDGKIVIGGFLFTGTKNDFLILRLNSNGSIDTAFGALGGFTITSVSGGSNSIKSLIQQSDGKIVAGGSGYIVRYTTNGTLDTTFATNGVTTVPHGVSQLLKVANDKFLVAGSGMHVSRFNADGTLDTGFNGTGTFSTTVAPYSCACTSVAVQTDGKIVLGGDCFNNTYSMAVFRVQETAKKTPFDFDGDSKTDVSIFRPSNGEWWISRSSTNQIVAAQFGSSSDKTVPADFTGDGKTDIAFWRESSGQWFVLRSEDSSFYAFPFGSPGDIAAPGDFDGDGKADAAVFRPSNAVWYILRSTDNGLTIRQFGASGDQPVVSDYDGDGKSDIAIFRPSVSEWWLLKSGSGQTTALQFGASDDKTVPGDYTGDGKADVAFFRPSTGEWFVLRSEDFSYYAFAFGTAEDIPAPGDYDGDGKFDAAVFRPSNSVWYQLRSTSGFTAIQFGTSGDQPIPNAFVR